MRYWALAGVLSHYFDVLLLAPVTSEPAGEQPIPMRTYTPGGWATIADYFAWADTAIIGSDVLLLFPQIETWQCPLVVDGYDPHPVETLAIWAALGSLEEQEVQHTPRMLLLSRQCLAADFVICASEVQRTWWLGLLEAHGRVNPYTFGSDPSLRCLVDVVPFGLPSDPFPVNVEPEMVPGVSPEDVVLLWGGGLWEWTDPITVIAAMPDILRLQPHAKLLFPGTRHPNLGMPAMPKVDEAKKLSQRLGLADTAVFFGDWVPRQQWNNYLARADIGLSAHADTLEARLAFRTRVLDYVWAGLPMVVTKGDGASNLVESYDLGLTVEPGDACAMATAILKMLERPRDYNAYGFAAARAALTWDVVARPLIEFCATPRRAVDKAVAPRVMGSTYYKAQISSLDNELERMRTQLAGYERGRFVRLMRWLRRRKSREAVG